MAFSILEEDTSPKNTWKTWNLIYGCYINHNIPFLPNYYSWEIISEYTVVYLKIILEKIMVSEFTLYQHLSCHTRIHTELCLTWRWIPQDKILVWEGGQIKEKLLHVSTTYYTWMLPIIAKTKDIWHYINFIL